MAFELRQKQPDKKLTEFLDIIEKNWRELSDDQRQEFFIQRNIPDEEYYFCPEQTDSGDVANWYAACVVAKQARIELVGVPERQK